VNDQNTIGFNTHTGAIIDVGVMRLIVPWEGRRKSDEASKGYNELWWNHESEGLNG